MRTEAWLLTSLILLCIISSIHVQPTVEAESPEGWTQDARLTDADQNSSTGARVAFDSADNLHIVYNDFRHGPGEIYYMKLDSEGNILVDEKAVSDLDAASSTMGDMVVDSDDNIHIVWSDVRDTGPLPNLELYYEKLDSDGNTLVDETRITFLPYYSFYPSMALDSSDNIHIAYCDEYDVAILQEEIHYMKLDNNGNILVDDTAVTPVDGEESLFPDIAVDSLDNVHIVWLDDRNETGTTQNQDYYYSKLDGSGNTLVDDTMIFEDGDHFRPSIAVDSHDMIQMVISNRWFLATNEKKHMYYMKLDGDGNPVIPANRLSVSDENASRAAVSLDSQDNVRVVWEDERHGEPEIYFMELNSTGATLQDELRLTENQYNSTYPVITVNGQGAANVVWSDDRDFTYWYSELYYKRSLLEPANEAPTVEIIYPYEGQELSGIASIQGEAWDAGGSVVSVEIKIGDGTWFSVTGTESWSHQWNTSLVDNGQYTVHARSFDGTQYSSEDMVNITVNNIPPNEPPSVTMVPISGVQSGTVKVNGTASDSDGSVLRVELKINDGNWFSVPGTTVWSYSWDTTQVEDGEHVVTARSVDDLGEYSSHKTISVTVNNWVNTPPQIGITSPAETTVSGDVLIAGWASDADGIETVVRIEVLIESVWRAAQGTSTWSYAWDTSDADDGEYVISSRAFDGHDYSDVVSVAVELDNPHPPTLTITSEIPEKASGTLTIQGTAYDEDGHIRSIAIQVDDGDWRVFSESGQWSYELDTTDLDNGMHSVKIRVIDDEGESHIETFTVDVENSGSFPFWALAMGFIILVIMLIIIGWKMRKKPADSGELQS